MGGPWDKYAGQNEQTVAPWDKYSDSTTATATTAPAPIPYQIPAAVKNQPKVAPTPQEQQEQSAQQLYGIHPFQNSWLQYAAGPIRAGWNAITGIPSSVMAAFTPLNQQSVLYDSPEEKWAKENPVSTPVGNLPAPLATPINRLGYRMMVKPAIEAHQTANELRAAGHPIAAAGAELGAIPIVGPMGVSAGQRSAAGDPLGAVTESVANAFMLGAPDVTGEAVGGPASAVLNKFNLEPKLRAFLQNVTGTGKELTEDAVNKTIEDAAQLNAENAKAAKEYRQKVGATAQKNAVAEAAATAKKQAQLQTVAQGSQIIQKTNELRDKVYAKASQKYEDVKAAVGDDSVPRQDMIDVVDAAKKKWIRGSADSTKEFDQIVRGVVPETEASTIAEQFQKAYGHKTMTDALQDERVTKALQHELNPDQYAQLTSGYSGMSFNDLQGFYEELGARLRKGGMAPDITKAVGEVRDAIGDKMEEVAARHGVKGDLIDARNYYRKFADTFRDSKSPVSRIADSRDPADAFSTTVGAATDDRMAQFRDFANEFQSPETVKLMQDMQQTDKAAGARASGKRTPYPKEPEPKPVSNEAPDVQKLKAEQAHEKFSGWKGMTRYDLTILGTSAIAPFISHAVLPYEIGALAGRLAIPRMLDTPRVIEWLSKPTAEDMAALQKLPPEYQADVARQMTNFLAQQKSPVNVSPIVQQWLQKGAAAETKTEPKPVDKSKRKHP